MGYLGNDFEEALFKSLISVGYKFQIKNVFLSTGPTESKILFLSAILMLKELGIKLYATNGTVEFMRSRQIECEILHWLLENAKPNVVDFISNQKIDLVINIPKSFQDEKITNDYIVRRKPQIMVSL